tara:strand:- start:6 stop:443 length:438 start_codon:yes stop_codon:yes gene_type:complete
MAYSKEDRKKILDQVFEEMREGKSVRAILRDSEDLPANKTILEWVDKDEDYSKQYARAIKDRADFIFEEIMEIADESSQDTLINDNGEEKINSEFVQRSRLRIDARKWMLGKMDSKKYGDRVTNELIGDSEKPLSIEITKTYDKK